MSRHCTQYFFKDLISYIFRLFEHNLIAKECQIKYLKVDFDQNSNKTQTVPIRNQTQSGVRVDSEWIPIGLGVDFKRA